MSHRVAALALSSHPEPTVAVTAVVTGLSLAAGQTAWRTAAMALACLVGHLSVGWCNDAVDAERDRAAGRRDKPVARGDVPRRLVRVSALVALALVWPVTALVGWRAATAHLVAVLSAWAYNLGLKGRSSSYVPYAVSFALLPTTVTLALPDHPLPPVWAPVSGALLGVGAHLANALPDLADDLAAGLRGLPHRLGEPRSQLLAAVLLAAASALIVVGSGLSALPATTALVATAALVGTGLVLARRPGSRAAFRATMAIAALDVALLLSAGGSLTG